MPSLINCGHSLAHSCLLRTVSTSYGYGLLHKIMTTTTATFLLVISLLQWSRAIEIRQEGLKDFKGITGSKAEIVCQVDNLRDPLEECYFYGPRSEKYSGRVFSNRRKDDDEDARESIQVVIDDRRDECILEIRSLKKEDEGLWECVAYEGRDEASKFAVVRVTDKNAPLQLLLDPDETQLNVQRGRDVQMICPTNHFGSTAAERPICKFIDPEGKGWLIVGK